MERCPVCGKMTYEYDYARQEWVCVCYDCAETRDNGAPYSQAMPAERKKTNNNNSKQPGFKG